jgi:hypothetical protein
MDKMYDVPKKKSKELDSKFSVSTNSQSRNSRTGGSGALNPNYIKDMLAAGRARRAAKPKINVRDNSNVNKVYGPIAGSAVE